MTALAENGSTQAKPAAEPFLSRVVVRNYKSIAECDLSLRRLTVLVGRNGAGKSNLLDAIRFVADAVENTPDRAIRARGGIDAVRRTSTGHPRNFSVSLRMNLPERRSGSYGFEIAASKGSAFSIKREQLEVREPSGAVSAYFRRVDSDVAGSLANFPPVAADRLFLVNAAAYGEFRSAYDGIVSMGFYNLNPTAMKLPQTPDAGELLRPDGSNIASVVARLDSADDAGKRRLQEYLGTIVPGVSHVERVSVGPSETLRFRQQVAGAKSPWWFYAQSMSDGTLRALGLLVAVMQLAGRHEPVSLIGVEEPETALHPAAAGALVGALREAARHTQVLLTCHSPDLLDVFDIGHDALLVVRSTGGTTEIAPFDKAAKYAIKRHLYSAGDLLRRDQLQPDPDDLNRQRQATLFDELQPAGSDTENV